MEMLRGKMPNNCRGDVAIGKVNLLLLASLLTTSACVFRWPQPKSDLHAVTDGKLTLGVVASEDKEGLQAYRLLLCKKFTTYDAAIFADRTKCLPGLVDGEGREVVIFHNPLRRGFAAKYRNYAQIGAGVALAIGAVFGLHKWFAKGSKYADDLTSEADTALKAARKESKRLQDEDFNAPVAEFLQKSKVTKGEADKIQQDMQAAFQQADKDALEKVLTRIEGIDPDLGKSLKAKLADSSFIDADLLENLAKRVEETDAVFASNMREAASINREIGQNGLYHFGNLYRDAAKMFDKDVRKTLVRLADGDATLKELTNAQKIAIATRVRKADTFHVVAQLRHYEMEKGLLTELNAGKPTLAEMKTSLQKLTDEVQIDAEDYLTRTNRLMNSNAREQVYVISWNPTADLDKLKKLLKNFEAEESLLGQPPPTVEKIYKIAAYKKAIRKYETDGFKLESELSKINDSVSERYMRLYRSEADRYVPPDIRVDAKEIGFWNAITEAEELPAEARKSRIASLKRDIDAFEADLRVKTAEFDAANEAARVSREAAQGDAQWEKLLTDRDAQWEKLLTERQSNVVQRLREGAQATADGNTAQVQKLRQVAEEEREAWGMSGLMAGLGVTALVYASLDKSIWGYGEKQLGKHWSQIFSDKASFADAVSVTNLPAVLNKLADVLGHKVNTAALKL